MRDLLRDTYFQYKIRISIENVGVLLYGVLHYFLGIFSAYFFER